MISILFWLLSLFTPSLAIENNDERFKLIANEISDDPGAPTYQLGSFKIDEMVYFRSAIAYPFDTNEWCIALYKGEEQINPCFQFYRGSLDDFQNGELSIQLNANGEIKDISFNSDKSLKDIQLKISQNINIQSPSLRFQNNNKNEQGSNSNSNIKYDSGESKNKLKGPLGSDLNTLDSYDDSQFSEIILPDSKQSNKTFIERHWKLIVPPLIILVLMGMFIEPAEDQTEKETTEKSE